MRLDSGFQGGELLSYLKGEGVEVVMCLATNKGWKVHLPDSAPWQGEWLAVAGRLGAVATP